MSDERARNPEREAKWWINEIAEKAGAMMVADVSYRGHILKGAEALRELLPSALSAARDEERIVRAAIREDDAVFSLPPPARHGHIIALMAKRGTDHRIPMPEDQGFLTSAGRFVDRYTAWHIAKAARQTIGEHVGPDGMLFSEDLW